MFHLTPLIEIHVVGINNEELRKAAKVTEGFSGRQLSKLAIAWQAAAFGSIDNTLTYSLMLRVLDQHLQQQEQKSSWLKK